MVSQPVIMRTEIFLRSRFKAASIHLAISSAIALLAAGIVFLLWYPWPYRVISGGQSLFLLVVSVDVVMGPLLTMVTFNPTKTRHQLVRDLSVIGILQFAALVYGVHTVFVARPIALVFEVDRFQVVAANDVYTPELNSANAMYQRLPLTGPWLLGTRKPTSAEENSNVLFTALQGFNVAQRPKFWVPYAESKAAVLAKARPISVLIDHYPDKQLTIRGMLKDAAMSEAEARFLPLVARESWVIVLNGQGDVVNYVALNGFF